MYYRYEFLDGMGIWRSDSQAREELYNDIADIGAYVPTPTMEDNYKAFFKILAEHPNGIFWFTTKGYEKFQDKLDRLSTNPNIVVKISDAVDILWSGASGLQVYAKYKS